METFMVGFILGGLVCTIITIWFRMRDASLFWKYIEENNLRIRRIQDLIDENQRLTEKLRERLNANTTDKQWLEEYQP